METWTCVMTADPFCTEYHSHIILYKNASNCTGIFSGFCRLIATGNPESKESIYFNGHPRIQSIHYNHIILKNHMKHKWIIVKPNPTESESVKPNPPIPYNCWLLKLYEPVAISSSVTPIIFIREIPYITKNDQRPVRQHTHKEKTFIRVSNIQPAYVAAVHHTVDGWYKSVETSFCLCIRITFHADNVKYQHHQIITADLRFIGQNLANPLSGQSFWLSYFWRLDADAFLKLPDLSEAIPTHRIFSNSVWLKSASFSAFYCQKYHSHWPTHAFWVPRTVL